MNNENKIILFGDKARSPIMEGMKKVYEAVRVTMGPAGRNVLIEDSTLRPIATKDGVTVASRIKLSDRKQDMGAQLIKNVSRGVADTAGDGPLPLYTKVVTPKGMVEFGSLEVGDVICGTNNTVQTVEGYFPQGEKQILELHMRGDKRVVECCEDHLWTVNKHSGETLTIPTKTVKELLESGERLYIPYSKKVMEAYAHNSTAYAFGGVVSHNDKTLKNLPSIVSLPDINIDGGESLNIISGFNTHKSEYYNVEINGNSYIKINNSDVARYIKSLYHSLDTPIEYIEHTENIDQAGRAIKTSYYIRELERNDYGHEIESVEYTNRSTEMACIKVSNDDSLYYVEDFVLTHNTTNSTVLAYNLLKQGMDAIKENPKINLIDFKRGMDKATEDVVKHIEEMSTICKTTEDIHKIAMISSNGDSEISALVTDAVYKTKVVDGNGTVDIDSSVSTSSFVEFSDAMTVNSGYDEYFQFVNNPKDLTFFGEDIRVLIFDGDIGTLTPTLKRIIVECHENNETLLFFANNFSPNVVLNFTQNLNNGLRGVLVKSPEFGTYKKKVLSDIAVATNTTVIGGEGAGNLHLEAIKREDLGYASNVTVHTDKTYIKVGVREEYIRANAPIDSTEEAILEKYNFFNESLKQNIRDYCSGLEMSKKSMKEIYEKNQTDNRIRNLSSIKATINLGGMSTVEVEEKKQRVEDAVFATTSAIEEGYVLGGGVTLAKISRKLKDNSSEVEMINESFNEGYLSVLMAIQAPLNQILNNAFLQPDVAYSPFMVGLENVEIDLDWDSVKGFDVRTLKHVENMVESGIIDPAKVIRCAIQNANSVSSVALTTEALIFSDAYYSEEIASKDNHYMMYGEE